MCMYNVFISICICVCTKCIYILYGKHINPRLDSDKLSSKKKKKRKAVISSSLASVHKNIKQIKLSNYLDL